jgi:hypothetical protein
LPSQAGVKQHRSDRSGTERRGRRPTATESIPIHDGDSNPICGGAAVAGRKAAVTRLATRGAGGVGTLRIGYPHVQALSQDNGSSSRLPARGSFGAATCPGSRLLAQGSSGANTCPEDRLYRLQATKQISHGDPAIMITIVACAHVSSKALRNKGCFTLSQRVQQATHQMQTRRVVGKSQWFATVPSGSTTLGYNATATWRRRRGPHISQCYESSDATTQCRTED